jgi:enediyne biosynthesis protein E4
MPPSPCFAAKPALRRQLRWWLALLALGSAGSLGAQGVATSNAAPAPRAEWSGKPFPVRFTDVAEAAGLAMKFTYGDEKTKKYIIEVNGGGVAFFDYDNDGWLDLFFSNGSRLEGFGDAPPPTSRLFRNTRDGHFADVTKKAGLGFAGWGGGVCAGDIDNDGHLDLFAAYWGPNRLYRNNGDGTFADIAAKAGVAGPATEWSSGCTFLDYDRDGLLDLFVTSYQQFDPAQAPQPGKGSNCEWKGMPVFCGPRGLPYGRVTLFHNRGHGSFEDVTQKTGIGAVKGFYAFTAVAADLNRDGWVDLFVACDSTPSLFFRNNGDGTFSEIGAETALAFNEHGFEQGGMGIAIGDYDRDGWLDLIKTNFAGDYPNVFHNLEDAIFEDVVVRTGLAVNPRFVGWGVGLVDLDNDGWQDVFQVNGHVYPELDQQDRVQEEYRQRTLVYRNLGGGRFEDVSERVDSALDVKKSSRGAAFGDFDNDGDIDVAVMNMGEAPSLYRNDLSGGQHWIELRLEGTKSNRSAIGATVTIEAGGVTQTKPVVSESSYVSHSDLRVHFGLGDAAKIEAIRVRWPSGVEEKFAGVEANQQVLLVEGSGAAKAVKAEVPR